MTKKPEMNCLGQLITFNGYIFHSYRSHVSEKTRNISGKRLFEMALENRIEFEH